jgi:spore coat protein H
VLLIMLNSCRKNDIVTFDTISEFPDWSETSHGETAEPDYSVVFKQSEILRFDIEISSSNWSAMESDLEDNIGSGGFGGPGGNFTDFDPIWVPCSFNFEGKEWYNVGIRFKGNSSLQSAYLSGIKKLSMKLDFDQFDEYNINLSNQRFYGFRQLNLNNNFEDASLIREKVGADLFRNFGLVSSHTAFCVIYIDHGEGPQYFGVYTLVEEVDDTVLEDQFADGSGNLYKPDGDAASFAAGTFDESEMEKKSNYDLADYSDVQSLYDVINSSDRNTNEDQWKNSLESVFNVDTYMKWLAANIVIQNWDTYGIMTHNYYLYNNPSDQKLTWIPWDNNEAFQEGKQGGALSIYLYELNENWPLIRYLIDVDEYREMYDQYLNQFIEEVFIPAEMIQTYNTYFDMLQYYAYEEEEDYTFLQNASAFDQALQTLQTHVQSRKDVVRNYLNE